jgi:hypothetical protein
MLLLELGPKVVQYRQSKEIFCESPTVCITHDLTAKNQPILHEPTCVGRGTGRPFLWAPQARCELDKRASAKPKNNNVGANTLDQERPGPLWQGKSAACAG